MAPDDKNPYEYKLPENYDSPLKKYSIHPYPVKRYNRSEEAPISDRKGEEFPIIDKLEHLTEKISRRGDRVVKSFVDEMNSSHPPGILKQLIYLGKLLFYTSLLLSIFLIFILALVIVILFVGGLASVGFAIWVLKEAGIDIVKIVLIDTFRVILRLHQIYVLGTLLLLLFVGAYIFVYNPYISSSPTVDLHMKSQDNKELIITNNRSATDVPYARLLQFLDQDTTDSAVGVHSAAMTNGAVRLHDNAEKQGIRSGVAKVSPAGLSAHVYCWNVFNTTDHGSIYVSAYHPVTTFTCDSLVYIPKTGLDEGKVYYIPIDKVPNPDYEDLSESMGKNTGNEKITGIEVVW